MFISVKILQGEECTIEVSGVSASSSISAVKHLVAQQLQIPVDQQRLVFRGKTLSDSLSLGDYNIVEGNRLHLFVLKAADSATVVWDQMRKFLLSQFSHEDAEKVLEEYKKEFSQSVSCLSLDDIERWASSILGTTSTTTSTSGDAASRPPPGRDSGSSLLVLSNNEAS